MHNAFLFEMMLVFTLHSKDPHCYCLVFVPLVLRYFSAVFTQLKLQSFTERS